LNPPGVERFGLHDLRHSLIASALAGAMTPPRRRGSPATNPGVTMAMYAGLTDTDKAAVWGRFGDSGFGQ
jgi:hypothetical protein